MRILVVEDNKVTAEFISQGLKDNAYIVDLAYDGAKALKLVSKEDYQLIILDIMLPKIDGYSVLGEVRKLYPALPIIFLSAKDLVEERVRGLNLGADDYLVKPFAFSELLARINTLLRRKTLSRDLLNLADLRIDTLKHKVYRADKPINLTAKEYKLLLFMLSNKGEILSRATIAAHVWDIHFDCDTNIIDVAIKRLRDKIDRDFVVKLIHAVRGVGYVIQFS